MPKQSAPNTDPIPSDPDGSRQGDAGPDDLEDDSPEARGAGSGRVTEGEVRAAAAVAATSSLAGHNATLDLYLETDEGKAFIEVESKERQKAAEEEIKRIKEEQKRSNAAMKEYKRRVAAEAQQTRAVRDAAQQAEQDEAEQGKGRGSSDRTPQSAAR